MKRTVPPQRLALQRNATRPAPQRTFHIIDASSKTPKTLNEFEPTKRRVVVCEDVCTSDGGRIMA
jgi:orotate phosphoribosyltransferase